MARNIAAGLAVGIVYYYVLIFFVGIVAAIAWPYTSFASENKILSLLIWGLVTTVPTIMIVSSIFGFAISRLVTSRFLLTGLIATFSCFAYFIAVGTTEVLTAQSVVRSLYPNNAYQAPVYVALYCSLPLATWYFGSRAKVA